MKSPLLIAFGLLAFTVPTASAAPVQLGPVQPVKPFRPIKPVPAKPQHQRVKVKPGRITNLVPQALIRGDREFGGNGPDINCEVGLRLSSDRRSILADIHFRAVETRGDRSTTDARWQRTVYRAPAGKTIRRIVSPTRSAVSFRSKKAGFQLFAPGEDVVRFFRRIDELALKVAEAHAKLMGLPTSNPEWRKAKQLIDRFRTGAYDVKFRGNHVHNVAPVSGPVAMMSIVGDTGGNDISDDNNGKDDTRIEAITFQAIEVELR